MRQKIPASLLFSSVLIILAGGGLLLFQKCLPLRPPLSRRVRGYVLHNVQGLVQLALDPPEYSIVANYRKCLLYAKMFCRVETFIQLTPRVQYVTYLFGER